MPRYDLVEIDEPTIDFELVDYSASQQRKRRRWGWIIGVVGLAAILAAGVARNPALIQQYVDVPTLVNSVRSAVVPQAEEQIAQPAEITTATVESSEALESADTSDEPLAKDDDIEEAADDADSVIEQPLADADSAADADVESTAESALAMVEPEPAAALTLINVSADNPVGYSGTLLQSSSGSLAVVNADGASVLSAPAEDLLTILTPGTIVSVSGRTENKQWLMVTTDDGTTGWVTADSLVIFGLDSLPVTSDSAAEGIEQPLRTARVDIAGQDAATAAPTVLPSPTATATPFATPEPTQRPNSGLRIPTPAYNSGSIDSVFAVVRSKGTTLLSAPNGATVRSLQSGFTLNANGRSEDGSWLRVETTDGEFGWVGADRVVAFRVSTLPTVDASGRVIGAPDSGQAGSGQAGSGQAGSTGGGSSSSAGSAATPRPTPINSQGLPVAVITTTGARLNIRSGPEGSYQIIGKAYGGETFVVLGRSESSEWVQIEILDLPGEFGWVSSQYVRLNESINSLPQSNQVNFSADVYSDNASGVPVPAAVAANRPVANPVVANRAAVRPIAATPVPQQVARASVAQATAASSPVASAPRSAINSLPAASAAGLTGKLVFQESLGGTIYVYDFATAGLRTLSVGMDPAISPDGSKVTFSRFGGDGGIYTIDINGANEERIYVDTTVRSAKWSPDNNWIVFSRLTGEYSCRNIGFGICLENNPFLAQFTLDTKEERGLTRINANGDEFRDIAALNTAYTPDWNENGIVYQAVTSIEITEDKPDGDTSAVLKQTIGFHDPDWQPNGGRIIFQGKQGSHWEIFSVQPNGGGLQALTKPVTALVDALPSNVSPAWSPDGRHIAYVSNRAAGEEAGPWRLWVMDADGSNKRVLPIDVTLNYAFNKEQMVSWGR